MFFFKNDGTGLYSVETENGQQTQPMRWTIEGNTITLALSSPVKATYEINIIDYNILLLYNTYLCYEL
jgi:hypothetical protein